MKLEQNFLSLIFLLLIPGISFSQDQEIVLNNILDEQFGFKFEGLNEFDNLGRSITTGNINNDNYPDIIISAPQSYDFTGTVYVIFGNENIPKDKFELKNLDGSNGFVIHGQPDWLIGVNLHSNDLNGDGYDEIIIGSPLSHPNDINNAGSVHIIFGKQEPYEATVSLDALDPEDGLFISGIGVYNLFGNSITSADFNGDSISDLAIGATGIYFDNGLRGETYILFGTEEWSNFPIDISNLDGTNGFALRGTAPFALNTGDYNADDKPDLIIGNPQATKNFQGQAGETLVLFGKNEYDSLKYVSDLNNLKYVDNELQLPFSPEGLFFTGIIKDGLSGNSVSSSDYNNDGFDDILIGAPNIEINEQLFVGQTYIFFGYNFNFFNQYTSGSDSGLIKQLIIDSLQINIDPNDLKGITINGLENDDNFGASTFSFDVNNDGINDMLISAPSATRDNSILTGETYIIYGDEGLEYSTINLNNLTYHEGFSIKGGKSYMESGFSIAAVDLNNDHKTDLLIGAPDDSPNGIDAGGSVFVLTDFQNIGVATEKDLLLPSSLVLEQNYPNPFNPNTQITYALAEGAQVTLNVFNIMGQQVATLVNEHKSAGFHQESFDAGALSNGVYIAQIKATGSSGMNFNREIKMLLVK